MSKHTPTPWHLEEIVEGVEELKGMRSICGPDGDAPSVSDYVELADAELIVRAVNSHNALVAALERFVRDADNVADALNITGLDDAIEQARAALRAARAAL